MFMSICEYILSTLMIWSRSVIKGTLRRLTGLCELQRICYGGRPGAERAMAVEYSLRKSRNKHIKALVAHLDEIADNARLHSPAQVKLMDLAAQLIMNVKKIHSQYHPSFVPNFEKCIRIVWGYQQLFHEVEILRTTNYDCEKLVHEAKLMNLWKLLMPHEPLEGRITKQWQDIGFQGDDPKTDFRGMGMLGLENLLFFAKEYPGAASHVLSHSHHPIYGYTFAVVGINLTSMAYNLMKDGSAKTHLYNVSNGIPSVINFHRLYCYLFYEFDRVWIESKPKNMMEFTHIQQNFEKRIRKSLKNKATVFRININVDNI